jgi:hypothetical protein
MKQMEICLLPEEQIIIIIIIIIIITTTTTTTTTFVLTVSAVSSFGLYTIFMLNPGCLRISEVI